MLEYLNYLQGIGHNYFKIKLFSQVESQGRLSYIRHALNGHKFLHPFSKLNNLNHVFN